MTPRCLPPRGARGRAWPLAVFDAPQIDPKGDQIVPLTKKAPRERGARRRGERRARAGGHEERASSSNRAGAAFRDGAAGTIAATITFQGIVIAREGPSIGSQGLSIGACFSIGRFRTSCDNR
jgi:hypothetical protein